MRTSVTLTTEGTYESITKRFKGQYDEIIMYGRECTSDVFGYSNYHLEEGCSAKTEIAFYMLCESLGALGEADELIGIGEYGKMSSAEYLGLEENDEGTMIDAEGNERKILFLVIQDEDHITPDENDERLSMTEGYFEDDVEKDLIVYVADGRIVGAESDGKQKFLYRKPNFGSGRFLWEPSVREYLETQLNEGDGYWWR